MPMQNCPIFRAKMPCFIEKNDPFSNRNIISSTIRMPLETLMKLKLMSDVNKTPVCKIVEKLVDAIWQQQENKVTDTISAFRVIKEH
jgi:hypothetical protein